MCHTNKKRFIVRGIGLGILFLGLFSLLVLLLWNWLMPPVFGLTTITFFQALGLLVLSKILFFGFHRRGGYPRHFKSREYWKKKFEEENKSTHENSGGESI
jgi:predicted membrane chloride channel (bestrophin family)